MPWGRVGTAIITTTVTLALFFIALQSSAEQEAIMMTVGFVDTLNVLLSSLNVSLATDSSSPYKYDHLFL